MRVTFNGMFNSKIFRMQQRSEEYHRQVAISTTGKRLLSPASDPADYGLAMIKRSRIASTENYIKGLESAVNFASFSDGTLQQVQNELQRAYELTIASTNDSQGADSRAVNALELRALTETIIQLGNSTYEGFAIFGGGAETVALDTNGNYVGGGSPRRVMAADDYTITVGLSGDEVFDPPGGIDIITVLDQVATALETNDPNTAFILLDEVRESIDQISTSRAHFGTVINQSESMISWHKNGLIVTEQARTDMEDADMTEAYSNLTRAETAFQSTLQVSANVGQKSLFDYL